MFSLVVRFPVVCQKISNVLGRLDFLESSIGVVLEKWQQVQTKTNIEYYVFSNIVMKLMYYGICSYLHRLWLSYRHLDPILFCNITSSGIARIALPATSHEIIVYFFTIAKGLLVPKI